MNFFGIGPGEAMIVVLAVIVIFGPGKLPQVGGALGKSIREFRKATTEGQQDEPEPNAR